MTVNDFISVSAIGNMTVHDKRLVYFFDADHIPRCKEMFGSREIYIISALTPDHIEIILKNE